MPYKLNAITGELDLVNEGGGGGSGGIERVNADTGFAQESDGEITIVGNETQGVSTSATASTVTVTVDDATDTTKGVASFSSDDFTVSDGAVTLDIVSIAKGGTGENNAVSAFNSLAATTTKGDIIVYDGSSNIRFGVGSDGQVLQADSSEPSGVKWDTIDTGGDVNGPSSSITDNFASFADTTGKEIQDSGFSSADFQDASLQLDSIASIGNGIVAHTDDNTFTPRTISAGTAVFVQDGDGVNGNPIINVIGGGITWQDITADSFQMAGNRGYIANNDSDRIIFTLPVNASAGTTIKLLGIGEAGWRIEQNSGNTIHFGISSTTEGEAGYIESTHRRDSLELICITQNEEWQVIGSVGNITVV